MENAKLVNLYEGDQRCENLYQALKNVVYTRGKDLPVPAVIGVIEMLKLDLIKEQVTEAENDR